MLAKLQLFITFSNSLIELYKKNKTAFILGTLLLATTTYFNIDLLQEKIYGKTDITKEYIEKTYEIEQELESVRRRIGADEVDIFLLHNGTVTLSHLHMMKYTLFFQASETQNHSKFLLIRQPLSPYVNSLRTMLKRGYYLIEDTKNSDDILVQQIFINFNKRTIIYIPMMKSGNLIGFATASYVSRTPLSKNQINDIIRLMDVPESHL